MKTIVALAALLLLGYTNVYELGPLIDVKKTALTFEGSRQAR